MRSFSGESMTEANNMYQKALALGVPEANIMIEKKFSKHDRKHIVLTLGITALNVA